MTKDQIIEAINEQWDDDLQEALERIFECYSVYRQDPSYFEQKQMTKEEKYERLTKDLEGLTDENICEYLAKYERMYMVKSDLCDDSESECEYLRDLTDYLQIQIVRKCMKDNGYYYETRYGSPYWEKDYSSNTKKRTELINQLAYIFAYGRAVALQDVFNAIDDDNNLDMREIQKDLSITSHVLTQLNIKKQDKTMWKRYEKDVLQTLKNEAEPIKKVFENSDWKMITIE